MNAKAVTTARVLLGLLFLVFGLNGFLHVFAQPQMEGKAGELIQGLVSGQYVFPLLFAIYTFAGAALLTDRFVPLALTLLAPIVVNIVAIHLFLAPSGLPVAVIVLGLEVFLAWSHREAFRPLLQPRHHPAASTRKPAVASRARTEARNAS